MKIEQQTIEKYKIARSQAEDLSIIWGDIAAESETEEEYEICVNISKDFEEIEYDYFFLIKALTRYNKYEEEKDKRKEYKWKNREATEK